MSGKLDAATLSLVRDTKEVRIRTSRHKGRGVIIWAVVVDEAVFVRSVRGPNGKWFMAAVAEKQAMLEVGDRQVSVRVVPVADHATIEAVSRAFLTKYATSPYAQSIVRPETLPTTLRLE